MRHHTTQTHTHTHTHIRTHTHTHTHHNPHTLSAALCPMTRRRGLGAREKERRSLSGASLIPTTWAAPSRCPTCSWTTLSGSTPRTGERLMQAAHWAAVYSCVVAAGDEWWPSLWPDSSGSLRDGQASRPTGHRSTFSPRVSVLGGVGLCWCEVSLAVLVSKSVPPQVRGGALGCKHSQMGCASPLCESGNRGGGGGGAMAARCLVQLTCTAQVSKLKRHLDKVAVMKFWETLDR